MSAGQDILTIKNRCADYEQQELFPFDPWGAAHSFEVVDWPHPAISRAMIGPLAIGDPENFLNGPLKCLAVTADCEFAAEIEIEKRQFDRLRVMWDRVACELDNARRRPFSDGDLSLRMPKDCLMTWSKPEFWISPSSGGDPVPRSVRAFVRLLEVSAHEYSTVITDEQRLRVEQDARAVVVGQIVTAVNSVLRCLRRDLFEVVSRRRRISISVLHRLLALARAHSLPAVTYTLQAIKTESLPLLHLAASGYPQEESFQVRDALFNGHSLPSTLAEMGVGKAAHRKSLRATGNGSEIISGEGDELSELPLSGADWLTAMRTVATRPLHSVSDWLGFGRLVTSLSSLSFRDTATTPKLLQWCIAGGHGQSRYRLDRLVGLAKAIQTAAIRLANVEPTLDQTVSLVMTQSDHAHSDFGCHAAVDANAVAAHWHGSAGELAVLVARISGQSVEDLTKSLFDAHPGMPSDLRLAANITVQALNSLTAVVQHGAACGNCLRDVERAVQYAVDGLALYAVSINGQIAGTVALRWYGFNRQLKVGVREVTGKDNAKPSQELNRLSEVLADSWTTDEQMTAWKSYERACADWKRSMD